jgi:capsular polysaccharide biosynthesis protein
MLEAIKRNCRKPLLNFLRRKNLFSDHGPLRGVLSLDAWLNSSSGAGQILRRDSGLPEPGSRLLPPTSGDSFEIEKRSLLHANTFVAELHGALVYGPSVAVITPDRYLLWELSMEFGHPSENHGAMRRLWFSKPKHLRGTWALLAVTGGNTYYHHLLEVLPKAHLLRQAGLDPAKVDGVIVSGMRHAFQKDSWKILGLNPQKVHSLERGGIWEAERLIVTSPPSHAGSSPRWATDFVRGLFLQDSSPPSTGERLYLSRAGEQTRRFLDEEALWPELQKRGFCKFTPQGRSLKEQAHRFAGASCLVGPHGGAFTNSVFCQQRTRILELFNPRYLNPCYQNLALALGIIPSFFIGDKIAGDKKSRPADSKGDIHLEPGTRELFLRELDKLC